MRIEVRGYEHPDAALLVEAVQLEYEERYGGRDATPVDPAEFEPPNGLFLVGYLGDTPVATGAWRVVGAAAEIKRMYVAPTARRRGLARKMLAEVERRAVAAGYSDIILMTGDKQPESEALYRSTGYADIEPFGYYAAEPGAVHLGKTVKEDPCPSTRSAT